MKNRNCVLVIPALNPPNVLGQYVADLSAEGFDKIILVDDGSREEYRDIFNELKERYNCDLLVHVVNMGKGRALKDALNYYLNAYSADYKGVITADSDGQHLVKDVVRMDDEIGQDDSALILGVRDFDQADVPFKSRAGNRITRNVLKLLIGGSVTDTQTGLRGIPNRIAYEYLTLTGERFEYETTMLIESIKKDIPIREITIDTVYYDGNSETHFHPVKDSIRIYKLIFGSFIKYMFVSLSSFVLDYGLFCLLSAVLIGAVDATRVWVATVVARVISSLYNYFMNRNVVFKSERDVKQTIIRYYALAIVQMCCSAGLVLAATRGLHWPSPVIKPIVDTLLFLLSYQIQSRWIFRE